MTLLGFVGCLDPEEAVFRTGGCVWFADGF